MFIAFNKLTFRGTDMLNITQAAKLVGVTVKTLQRWDRLGKLIPNRTKTNRRVYTRNQIDEFLGVTSEARIPYVYCRVSSQSQRKDLKNQRSTLEKFVLNMGIPNAEFIEEIGGGLNFTRPKFLDIMKDISDNKVSKLIIAHKDRLCRFGFEYFQHVCNLHACEILILNQEKLSPQEEMVQDLMAITHTFSCRLYGLRNYKKDLKKALKEGNK